MAEASLMERLAEPFEAHEIKFKPQMVRNNRALAIAYVDARVVMDRLDEVFGPEGWQDAYHLLPNNSVVCVLRVKFETEWVEKSDVGSPSEQPDEGDRMKAAFSDALKRAAVKLGVGRYIYRLPSQWVDYDAQTRQLKSKPTLPGWAIPKAEQHDGKQREGTISRKQWDEIKAQLVFNGIPQRKFLEAFGLQKPGELPAERFAEALAWPAKYAADHPQPTEAV